jgi:tubulin--tyrosine ligase-like protein 12
MEDFLAKHELQLYSMAFPESLYASLYSKLTSETLDAGSSFRIQQHLTDSNLFTGQEVLTTRFLAKNCDVFLIDHAWTTRLSSVRETLNQNYKLLNRLKGLVKVRGDKIRLSEEDEPSKVFADYCLDFDEQGLSEAPALIPGTLGLSLWGNNIESIAAIEGVLPGLKAVWLNENPVSKDEAGLFAYFEQFWPEVEILNSKFTRNAGLWALQYVSNSVNLDRVTELDLSDRNIQKIDPGIMKQFASLRSLDISNNKLTPEWESALFEIRTLKKIRVDAVQEDWVWRNLRRFVGLKYVNENDAEKGRPELVDHVISKLWGYFSSYRLSTESSYDENAIWYVLDEFGSSILHSDAANCKLMPFLYYSPSGESTTYSLLWPTEDIQAESIIYRDYLENVTEEQFRSYRLCVWFSIPAEPALNALNHWKRSLAQHPVDDVQRSATVDVVQDQGLTIAFDLDFFAHSLSSPRFQQAPAETADVIWTRTKIIDPHAFETDRFLNQFPFETIIVMKNQLAQTVQQGARVDWFPLTFDLNHEFSAFMGEFLIRQKHGEDNHWIVKPINMSRGIDCQVTNSLDFVVRAMETGPKIVQKYITKPLLLDGKKIDLRFIVLLKSVEPLRVFVYEHFWIRSANQPFSLLHSQQFSYETHFTVMNYSGHTMRHIKDNEFISHFEEITGTTWAVTQQSIYKAIKELFVVAARNKNLHRDKSRAIYGLDIILDTNLQPYILEVNFCPDCERAVKYYPEFTNQVFNCLFFGETDGVTLL